MENEASLIETQPTEEQNLINMTKNLLNNPQYLALCNTKLLTNENDIGGSLIFDDTDKNKS